MVRSAGAFRGSGEFADVIRYVAGDMTRHEIWHNPHTWRRPDERVAACVIESGSIRGAVGKMPKDQIRICGFPSGRIVRLLTAQKWQS